MIPLLSTRKGRARPVDARTIILNSLEESQEYLERVLDDLVPDEMNWVPAGGCNSIIFTLWHLARVEDT